MSKAVMISIRPRWCELIANGEKTIEIRKTRPKLETPFNHAPDDVEQQACLTREEIVRYLKGVGYGWHISDLKIYDKPKEISEFKKHSRECYFDNLGMATPKCSECTQCNLTRAPQSFCFVEALQT